MYIMEVGDVVVTAAGDRRVSTVNVTCGEPYHRASLDMKESKQE